jgi:flagellar protein FlgJ
MEGIGMPGVGGAGSVGNPVNVLDQVKRNGTNNPEEIKKAAQAFEAYFIFSLLKEMRKTIPAGGLLGARPGKEIYESLLDESLAAKMAEGEGIGLTKLLVKKLTDQAQVLSEWTDK